MRQLQLRPTLWRCVPVAHAKTILLPWVKRRPQPPVRENRHWGRSCRFCPRTSSLASVPSSESQLRARRGRHHLPITHHGDGRARWCNLHQALRVGQTLTFPTSSSCAGEKVWPAFGRASAGCVADVHFTARCSGHGLTPHTHLPPLQIFSVHGQRLKRADSPVRCTTGLIISVLNVETSLSS